MKGVGGDIIIVEEAAVVDPALFYEVIMPLLQIDETALLCISTIKSSDNFYSELIHKKDSTGNPVFKVHMFYNSCEVCRKTDKPGDCTHLKHNIPHWQSNRKHHRLKAFFESNKALYEQEILGISHDVKNRAFLERDLQPFFNKQLHTHYPQYNGPIFIAIDPSGGGSSDFAVTSTLWNKGVVLIVGMESVSLRMNPHKYEKIIIEHCSNLRKLYNTSPFIFILENNLGLEAAHLERFIRTCFNQRSINGKFMILREDNSHKIGVLTNHYVKEKMYYMLLEILKDSMISISTKFICISDTTENILNEMKKQFRDFSIIQKGHSNPFQKVSRTFTGKISSTNKDDLIISLQLNLFWSKRFRHKERIVAR